MDSLQRLSTIVTSINIDACKKAAVEYPSAETVLRMLRERIMESHALIEKIYKGSASQWEADVAAQDICILREAVVHKLNGSSAKFF